MALDPEFEEQNLNLNFGTRIARANANDGERL